MKQKFLGTYAELQDRALLTGIFGEWRDLGNQKQYRTDDGAILNWWKTSKTINFQGEPLAASRLETALASVIGADGVATAAEVPSLKRWRRLHEENATLKRRLGELINENAKLKKRASGD